MNKLWIYGCSFSDSMGDKKESRAENFVDFLIKNNEVKENLKNNNDFITFAKKNPFLVHHIRKYFRITSKYL